MADSSFDIVSEVDFQEVTNAIDQTKREIGNRFDFKGSVSDIELKNEEMILVSDDEGKLKQLKDVLHSKLIKRGIDLKAVKYESLEQAAGQSVRQKAGFISGIPKDTAKTINKEIKDSKLKVKSQTMDEKVRVTAKSKDDLQQVMAMLKKSAKVDIPLQFTNYR